MIFQDLKQDVRVSLRNLLRAPLLTLTVVATVGLGIGATTAIFSAVSAAILRPLLYANPEQLVRIYTDAPPNKFPFSVADYLALQSQHTRFAQIAGYTSRPMAYSDGRTAERVRGKAVSWSYFGLLGITPAIGRGFTQADGKPGGPQTVIVSHGFWQQRLGGRPDVLGQRVRLDGSDYEITGVLPQTVGPLEQNEDFFVAAQWETPRRKGPFFITVLGRLRQESDRSAAASELRAINRRIFPLWQTSYQDEKASWGMIDLKEYVVGDVANLAGVALSAVALVWLIACANASNLMVARVTSRHRELAVRAALGASRARVMRYLLAESGLLAIGAAIVGIALASAGVSLLRDLGPRYIPRAREIALGGQTAWLLAALTAASALLFGLVPALQGTGRTLGAPGNIAESLRSLTGTSTGHVAVRRLRRALVGSQFAVATPLLVVAGLLIGSLNALRHVDLGFDSHNVLTGGILLPSTTYPDATHVMGFWDELQRRVEALPGVSGVAFSDGRPPNDVNNHNNFNLEASPTPPGDLQPVTPWVSVTPEYFRLLGLTLTEGRLFDTRDGVSDAPVVVVDRAWAARFFPNGNALGQRLHEGGCTTCPWTTVVGVVSTVKYTGLDRIERGSVYTPMPARGSRPDAAAAARRVRYLLLRTSIDPAGVMPAVRQVIRDLDPTLPFSSVATIDDLIAESLQIPRSLSLLVASLAAVALLLSIVGIYGVMAYYVQQHSKEISIRLALGGSPADVLRLIVGQGMNVVASGVVVGLLTAFVLARLMSTLLFGVGAADAFTFGAAAILMLAVALIACLVPATRAIGVPPAAVLRNE